MGLAHWFLIFPVLSHLLSKYLFLFIFDNQVPIFITKVERSKRVSDHFPYYDESRQKDISRAMLFVKDSCLFLIVISWSVRQIHNQLEVINENLQPYIIKQGNVKQLWFSTTLERTGARQIGRLPKLTRRRVSILCIIDNICLRTHSESVTMIHN